ncbi:MAG: hypothetical protein KAI29_04575 [Cyclobacteriaceae bacterium]|nr:hypothetical protein [Cyclobacteriaceae bacterium]
MAVLGNAKQLGGDVLHSIPEGALEVPDTSGQAAAEFFATFSTFTKTSLFMYVV